MMRMCGRIKENNKNITHIGEEYECLHEEICAVSGELRAGAKDIAGTVQGGQDRQTGAQEGGLRTGGASFRVSMKGA